MNDYLSWRQGNECILPIWLFQCFWIVVTTWPDDNSSTTSSLHGIISGPAALCGLRLDRNIWTPLTMINISLTLGLWLDGRVGWCAMSSLEHTDDNWTNISSAMVAHRTSLVIHGTCRLSCWELWREGTSSSMMCRQPTLMSCQMKFIIWLKSYSCSEGKIELYADCRVSSFIPAILRKHPKTHFNSFVIMNCYGEMDGPHTKTCLAVILH